MPSGHRDPLHELILSLTPSEKRYFKLQNKTEGGTKSYLQLFDALEQLDEYDELKLRKALAGQKLLNQLHVAKNYLSKQILRALRSFHAGSDDNASPFLAFAEHIGDMNILHAKGLFAQSKKALAKAEDIAEKYDDDLLRLIISSYRHDRVAELVDHKNVSRERFKQRVRLLERLRLSFSLKHSLEQLYDSLALNAEVTSVGQLDTIAFDELSFASKIDHCSYRCYEATALHNYGAAATAAREALDLFDEHPHQRDKSTEIYLSLLSNYFTCLLNDDYAAKPELRDEKEFERSLQGFDNVKARTSVQRTRVWATRRLAQFEWALATASDDRISVLLTEFEREFKSKQKLLSKLEQGWFYFIISKSYFWTARPAEALKWINDLLDDSEFKRYAEYYGQAMLYSLILHLELSNFAYLTSAVVSTRRFLESRGLLSSFDAELLHSLSRATSERNDFTGLHSAFNKSLHDPESRADSRYFEFGRWLKERNGRKETATL